MPQGNGGLTKKYEQTMHPDHGLCLICMFNIIELEQRGWKAKEEVLEAVVCIPPITTFQFWFIENKSCSSDVYCVRFQPSIVKRNKLTYPARELNFLKKALVSNSLLSAGELRLRKGTSDE
jgi:hypothetical protein